MEDLKGTVGDHMTPFLNLDGATTVEEAARTMRSNEVGAILVSRYHEFMGIVSETDLTHKVLAAGLDPQRTPLSQVVTNPFICMERHRGIEEAGEFMCRNRVRYVAVTEQGKPVGLLSVKDLFDYCARTFHLVK